MEGERKARGGGSTALAAALRDPNRDLAGTVISTVDPVFAEVAASRFDLVWIDLEHSALSPRDVQMLVICARSAGAFSLIRLAGPGERGIGALLDTGADGIVIPRVDDAEELRDVVRELRFPPDGTRGYAPRRDALTNRRRPHERPACIVQVESEAAVHAAQALAAVDVCDALVVGTSDLSFDLGSALELDHPEVAGAVRTACDAAVAAGKGWGVAGGGDPARLRGLTERRGGTVVYGSDIGLFAEAVEERVALLARDVDE